MEGFNKLEDMVHLIEGIISETLLVGELGIYMMLIKDSNLNMLYY